MPCSVSPSPAGQRRRRTGTRPPHTRISEPDPVLLRNLGTEAYRSALAEAINDEDLAAIRTYLQQQRAYGRDDFRAMVEAKTKRFASVRPAHRPAKPRSIIEAGK